MPQVFDARLLESGKGNGWKNIQSRANLIHGIVELDTQEGRHRQYIDHREQPGE